MKLRKAVKGIIAASVLLVLILDASTSLKGAQEGLHLPGCSRPYRSAKTSLNANYVRYSVVHRVAVSY